MAIELFGFRIGRADEELKRAEQIPSFTPPPNDDGALEVAAGGAYGTVIDVEGAAKNESELVTKYRELAMQPECESAIEDIVNEAIVTDERALPVEIFLDELNQPDRVKKSILENSIRFLICLTFRISHTTYSSVGMLMVVYTITS